MKNTLQVLNGYFQHCKYIPLKNVNHLELHQFS